MRRSCTRGLASRACRAVGDGAMVMEVGDEDGDNVLKSEGFSYFIYMKYESERSIYELNTAVIQIGRDVSVELISPRPTYHDRTLGLTLHAF